ncbi:tectonin domain-containing protein [Fulvivirga sediminis]|uniref:Uncharacterized protein n=1 Tax=Fulvivirga sediminis TaxID=2803949 RepID=A0A937FAI6_9BACT|nr:tectonin domain-containing protein [Fulvivirga sediminis]MBL3656928.1 hypothetical protein [Fulvivirga sediminis]
MKLKKMKFKVVMFIILNMVLFSACNDTEIKPSGQGNTSHRSQIVPYPLPLPDLKIEERNTFRVSGGKWQKLPGCAKDIAIGSVGDIAAIGCNGKVYRWVNNDWQEDASSQNASSITVDSWGRIFVTNDSKEIWFRDNPNTGNNGWKKLAGKALDIEVSANGDLYCVGTNHKVFKYDYYSDKWTEVPGSSSVSRITVDYSGAPIISNSSDRVWKYQSSRWEHLGGRVEDIAANRTELFATGTNGKVYWFDFFKNDWVEVAGAQKAEQIAVYTNDSPWVIVDGGTIYRYQ